MTKEQELYNQLIDLLHEAKDDPCSGLKIFETEHAVEYRLGAAIVVLPKRLAVKDNG